MDTCSRRDVITASAAATISTGAVLTGTRRVTAQENADFVFEGDRSAWTGVEPASIEGTENPEITLVPGREYTVVWENVDGRSHNFAIKDGEGNDIVSSPIISGTGETQTVTFTATREMETYYCVVHPVRMAGPVAIEGESTATATPTDAATDTPTSTATDTPTDAATDTPSGTVHEVAMVTEGDEFYFDPIGLHVEPGDTVRWVIDSGSHSSTAYGDRIPSDAEPWDSGILAEEGAAFEQELTAEGTYDYFCTPHKSLEMVGRLVVGEPGGPAEGDSPPDGAVPSSSTITEQGSVAYADFDGATVTPTSGSGTTDTRTATATATRTATEAGGGGDDTSGDGPGFGLGTGLAAVGAGFVLRALRRD